MAEPLTNPQAWGDGVWIRTRSGPTPKAHIKGVGVSVWHRVGALDGYEGRPRTACGYGPRDGFVWPSGGSRWEVARPGPYGGLPGSVCPRCRDWPSLRDPESETLVMDEVDLDVLAAKVAERLAAPLTEQEAPRD